MCERCRAGQMVEYRRQVGNGQKTAVLEGRRCERCGFTQLDNDEDIWSSVGL